MVEHGIVLIILFVFCVYPTLSSKLIVELGDQFRDWQASDLADFLRSARSMGRFGNGTNLLTWDDKHCKFDAIQIRACH